METMTTIRLNDGRTLAYEDVGDPGGAPILFAHGFGDSRLTRHPDDSMAARAGVRLIVPDRPGIGGSDPKPARAAAERADDLRELADALGVERFAVLAWSGGTPTGLACGARFPDRVTAIGVAAGFAPFDREGAYEGLNARMAKGLPGVRDNILAGAVEAHRPGGKGMALDMQLLFARHWGFEPEDVKVPVKLWYGDADDITPPQMGRYLAERLPDAELTVYPGEAHMLVIAHWAEILRSLAASVSAVRSAQSR